MRAALLVSVALIASPAFAQTNNQYQGGDAASTTVIDVGQTQDAAATAVASGNVLTAGADTDASLRSNQHMDGDTIAEADADVDSASGNIVASSAAVANGATAQLRGSTATLDAETVAHGDNTAITTFTGGHAENAATSASAAANVAAVSAEDSDADLRIAQESTGDTSAVINADHGYIEDQVVSGAIASANNVSVAGDTTTLNGDMRQTAAGGSVAASVNLNAEHATDASGNATASANSVAIDNQWGYVESRVEQTSSAAVSATSEVTLGDHFDGFGSSGAYGVGNQMLASNVGSDTLLNVVQDNAGDISANAAFAGEGGDSALASAAAYGNNVEGALCSQCDTNVPGLTADNTQVNSGDVTARARVSSAYTNTAAASSMAVGNAATFSARGPGNTGP